MRTYIFTLLCIVCLMPVSCVDMDDATGTVSHRVRLLAPEGLDKDRSAALVAQRTVTLSTSTHKYEAQTDAEGVAVFSNLIPGIYDVSASLSLENEDYRQLTGDPTATRGGVAVGQRLSVMIGAEERTDLALTLSKNGDIVIGKVFYAGSKGVRNYLAGKFVELYNQSDDSVDVSGLYLGLVESESTPAYTLDNLHTAFADSVVLLKQVFRIPASAPCLVAPGGTVLLVNSATDHTPNNDMEHDLSHADFEAKNASGIFVNNPDVPALELIYTTNASLSYMNLVQSGPCGLVIFRTHADVSTYARTYAYGKSSGTQWLVLPKREVVDAVDILRQKSTGVDVETKRLGNDIDAGYTNIQAVSGWTGEIVYRRTAGVGRSGQKLLSDTNNSSADFQVSTSIGIRVYDEAK